MYNLLKYSKNCLKTSGSLWNYYRDDTNYGAEGDINYSIKDSKSFDYKKALKKNYKITIEEKMMKLLCH